MRADSNKMSAVADWPVLTSIASVKSFLGLCSYYRRFVEGFATLVAPLHQLTRKNAHFTWDEACQDACSGLNAAMISAPVLPFPDSRLPFILDTDASAEGIGAVLSQVKECKEYVLDYYSYKFGKPERDYCVTRKELLAIVKNVAHFNSYLYGAEFVIRTEHVALRWLKSLKNPKDSCGGG